MLLDLYIYPHPVLSRVADPVDAFDEALSKLVADMTETMYEGCGVGLAAPQIGVSRQIFIVDTSAESEQPSLRAYINPKIILKDSPVVWNEGCLSLPGLYRDVHSFGHVVIEAQDVHGEVFREEAHELRAVAILHEYGHLQGHVFLDRLSPIKQRLARKFWAKNSRREAQKLYGETALHCVFTDAPERT